MYHIDKEATFAQMYWAVKNYFDTDSNQQLYYHDWTSLTLANIQRENPSMGMEQAVEALIEKLHIC